jgi:hypothetical protein
MYMSERVYLSLELGLVLLDLTLQAGELNSVDVLPLLLIPTEVIQLGVVVEVLLGLLHLVLELVDLLVVSKVLQLQGLLLESLL